ncbi:putative ATP-binding cassette protein subfamily B, member 2 [Trypanosoma theileri]|uniref:Putative ATP-binding cassette protein subfamily B, member 2 n=1 Tax=Trypanosoma theileri TaxID=67003 RepID=A0A1X0P748_9TRYP|nr:putative ATP-binding cassette protein subfamily B, member 2 [Trypanosoma theileri]ORC92776.1 putative ATP-binding cassette protein subfamily B, member 2 [Trypanosoma theileri]
MTRYHEIDSQIMEEEEEEEYMDKSKRDLHKKADFDDLFRDATLCDRFVMILGSIAAFANGMSTPVFMFVYGQMTYRAFLSDPKDIARQFAMAVVILGSCTSVLVATQNICWSLTAAKIVSRLKIRFFDAVLRQEIDWHDKHKPGELVSRMISDTYTIQNGIGEKIGTGIMNLGMGVFGFFFALIACWEITLLLLGILPIGGIVAGVMMVIVNRYASRAREHYSSAASLSTEVMKNIKTTQIFNREEYEVDRFSSFLMQSRKTGVKKQVLIGLTTGLITALIYLILSSCLGFSFYLIKEGRSDGGGVTSSFMSLIYAAMGVLTLFPNLISFMDSRSAAYKIIKTIDRIPEIDIESFGTPFNGFNDSIVFEMVSFRYNSRKSASVFNGLNFKIRKGEKIAFTGVTGCGKSTIMSLIQRFYDPTEGAILVDGNDLRLLDLYQWRQHIGVVSQEPDLFTGTIIDNVRMGNYHATMDEIISACKRSNIHETIIQLPQGYYTSLSEGKLSGGQKQRVAIARALVRNPSILLLDEATSALDRKSEMEMQEALNTLMKEEDMTVIVVAHRLSTIRHVDCIFHLERTHGEDSYISEWGTYDELVHKNGRFSALASWQNRGSVSKNVNNFDDNLNYNDNILFNDLDYGEPMNEADEIEEISDNQLDESISSNSNSTSSEIPYEYRAEYEVNQTSVSLLRVARLTKNNWSIFLGTLGSIISAPLLPLAAVIYGTVVTAMAKYAVDGNEDNLRKGILKASLIFVALACAGILSSLLQSFYGISGEHLTYSLRRSLFSAILRQDQSFFDIPSRDPGSLAGIISGDCEVIHQLWGPSIGSVVRTIVFIAAGIVIALIYQWKVALVAAACMPLVVVSLIIQDKCLSDHVSKKKDEVIHTITNECFSSIRTITAFNLKDRMVQQYRQAIAADQRRIERLSIFNGLFSGLIQFFFYGTVGMSYWYGSILIGKSEATFSDVMIASMAIMICFLSIGVEVGSLVKGFHSALYSAKKVFSIIDRVPDIDVYEPGDTDIGDGCDIIFEKVLFSYPLRPEVVVLNYTDLYFGNGNSNGLIGQTGCGKSTVIQILARFYNPKRGHVFINGKNLSELDIVTWRENISIVLQEPSLFSGTVRENIRYSMEDATDEEIEEAARTACIHDEILRMPKGYETQVGYLGRSLSGGQKQRVAIARAVLRRPRLLLLDEATSALDTETEALVKQNLDELQELYGMTSIIIAHNLATIRDCDQILIMEQGQCVERGTHDELILHNEEYKNYWLMTQ